MGACGVTDVASEQQRVDIGLSNDEVAELPRILLAMGEVDVGGDLESEHMDDEGVEVRLPLTGDVSETKMWMVWLRELVIHKTDAGPAGPLVDPGPWTWLWRRSWSPRFPLCGEAERAQNVRLPHCGA
jgi:hypothetical protein